MPVRLSGLSGLSDCQGLDSLDMTHTWSLSRSLDRALTLCQGSVKPLSIDIAVKPVKIVRLSVDRLSDCQAKAQPPGPSPLPSQLSYVSCFYLSSWTREVDQRGSRPVSAVLTNVDSENYHKYQLPKLTYKHQTTKPATSTSASSALHAARAEPSAAQGTPACRSRPTSSCSPLPTPSWSGARSARCRRVCTLHSP